MTLSYDESRMLLNVLEKDKKYTYKDIPLNLYNRISRLREMERKGEIWQILRKCEEVQNG